MSCKGIVRLLVITSFASALSGCLQSEEPRFAAEKIVTRTKYHGSNAESLIASAGLAENLPLKRCLDKRQKDSCPETWKPLRLIEIQQGTRIEIASANEVGGPTRYDPRGDPCTAPNSACPYRVVTHFRVMCERGKCNDLITRFELGSDVAGVAPQTYESSIDLSSIGGQPRGAATHEDAFAGPGGQAGAAPGANRYGGE